MIFKDHFSTNNAEYAAHRPAYPRELVDFLADAAPDHALALDTGCGTGQLSVLLAERFACVVGIDASAQQIANAKPHSRIAYHTASADHFSLPDRSVDLITVAQAAHWLDLDAFYAEARRVGRPRAVIALITYGVLHVEDAAAEAVMQRFYCDIIGPFWPSERRHVEDGYRSLPFPFTPLTAPPFAIEVAWNLGALIGYTDTWSAVRAAEKAVGRAPVERFHAELREVWGNPEIAKRVSWPLSLRIGRLGPL